LPLFCLFLSFFLVYDLSSLKQWIILSTISLLVPVDLIISNPVNQIMMDLPIFDTIDFLIRYVIWLFYNYAQDFYIYVKS
jgi:hypothetical protein